LRTVTGEKLGIGSAKQSDNILVGGRAARIRHDDAVHVGVSDGRPAPGRQPATTRLVCKDPSILPQPRASVPISTPHASALPAVLTGWRLWGGLSVPQLAQLGRIVHVHCLPLTAGIITGAIGAAFVVRFSLGVAAAEFIADVGSELWWPCEQTVQLPVVTRVVGALWGCVIRTASELGRVRGHVHRGGIQRALFHAGNRFQWFGPHLWPGAVQVERRVAGRKFVGRVVWWCVHAGIL